MAPYFATIYSNVFSGQGIKFGKFFQDNTLHFAYEVYEGGIYGNSLGTGDRGKGLVYPH